MADLPEVEVVRAALNRDIVGRKVKTATVNAGRYVRRHKTPKEFRTAIEGRTIRALSRLGTSLVLTLDNGHALVIDLGPSGHLSKSQGPKEVKPKHSHVVLTFTQGPELRLIDHGTMAEMYVAAPLAADVEPEISKFARLSVGGDGLALRKTYAELADEGIDALEDQIGWDRFAAIMRSRTTTLKAVLVDRRIFAGVGSGYADEMLFRAGLHPTRVSESLSTIEIRRLHRAMAETASEAVKAGGISQGEYPFLDLDGKPGEFQDSLEVFLRAGEPCLQCRTPIEMTKTRDFVTYFCPKCQA